jgi:hypothetical protein
MARPILPDDPVDPTSPGTGGGGGTPTPSTYGTLVMSVPITKLDAASSLDVTVYLNCVGSDDLIFGSYLFVDDVLQQVGNTNQVYVGGNAASTMTMPAIISGIAAGARVVSLRVKNRETDGTLTIQAGSLMKVSELRQAAR